MLGVGYWILPAEGGQLPKDYFSWASAQFSGISGTASFI
jgi:hypothetical protein